MAVSHKILAFKISGSNSMFTKFLDKCSNLSPKNNFCYIFDTDLYVFFVMKKVKTSKQLID